MTFSLDLPDVYLELLCCNIAAWGSTAEANPVRLETYVPFDPANYDGSCVFWFEVTVNNPSDSACQISLVDTAGVNYATITIPQMVDDYTWDTIRVPFAPPAAAVTFAVLFHDVPLDTGYDYCFCTAARIRIRQTGATKSRIQWPMLSVGGWVVGYEFPANSIDVYTSGNYYAAFDQGVGGDPVGSYANDCLQIWKYQVGDLDPVSAIEFRALPGKSYPHPTKTMYVWGLQEGTFSLWQGALFYSDDAGVTILPAFPGVAGTWHGFSTGTDPFPWTFTVPVDPALFVGGRQYYVGWSYGGALFYSEYTGFYFDPLTSVVSATFSGYTSSIGTAPGPWAHDNVMVLTLDVICDDANIEGLSIAVFDRDTNSMIAGSELSWVKGEDFNWKSCSIAPGALTSGHELEVRCSSPAATYSTAPCIGEAQLFFNVDPISVFTSWQRAMKGSVLFSWWGYPAACGVSYSPPGWDGRVSEFSRLEYHEIPYSTVNYQACAVSWAYPSDPWPGYHFDPTDPGVEYEYFALWNDVISDQGCTDGASRVDQSMLNWDASDFDVDAERNMHRTPANIIGSLVDGNRYCSLQIDDQYWLEAMDGYIVITVRESESQWTRGIEVCEFLFTEVPVIPCDDLPCTTPLCVPTATLEQYQGSLTAVAGPTARIK